MTIAACRSHSPRQLRRHTALDLFSGVGGLTQGLLDAGFEVLGAIEADNLAVDAYRANHPGVIVWNRQIESVSAYDVMRKLGLRSGRLDLLAGCPPCEGFSSIRTLNGSREISDPRNNLLFQFLRFAKALRPKSLMLENVPALADDDRFRRFCRNLQRMGYRVNWAVKDAQEFGVPQRRRRLVLIAGRKRKIEFAEPLRTRKTVRDTISNLPRAGHSGDRIHDLPERRSHLIKQRISLIPKDGGSRSELPRCARLRCHALCTGFKDVYGRMAWDEVAPTLTAGCFNPSKGRFLHPEEDRAITMREAALLQGFPRSYMFPVRAGKEALARMIGNALPPRFVRQHASRIKRYLRQLESAI
jgi:DNA (cytosine-5)-methyltransferase 1